MSNNSSVSSHKDGNHLQDGVVKYMSSVPTYLQKLEKKDNVQEKALNFGVLDWSRLENWTSKQQQTPNLRGGYSPSTSNSSPSPSFSTFESSSQSTRNSYSPHTSHTNAASTSTSKGKKFEDFLTRDMLGKEKEKEKEKEKCGSYGSILMSDERYVEESRKSFSGVTISSGSKSTDCHTIPHSCPLPSTNKTILEREKIIFEDQKNYVHRTEEDMNKNKLPTHIDSKVRKESYNSRQAVLKLAWENGFPLFVLSTDSGDILAATMGKAKANCYYMLFSACEIKRRGGFWNKSKNHNPIYNAVAQMRISSSEREFVLYGNEMQPSTHSCSTSEFNHELVAVINRVPNGEMLNNRDARQSNFVAIIPEGVHGSSSDGKPSPLIERWRNGGHCDCGGWDEGCSLTILTENLQEKNISRSRACLQVELRPKGEDRSNKHTFKMTAYEEGVYRVEYGESFALLQAFSICIAILHKKKQRTLTRLHHSMKSYVPSHPPYSPIRRD